MEWEMILIYVLLAAAVAYLIWLLFFPRKKKNTCAGCPGSGTCKNTKAGKRIGKYK